jgi:hypothetical protein
MTKILGKNLCNYATNLRIHSFFIVFIIRFTSYMTIFIMRSLILRIKMNLILKINCERTVNL